MVINSTAMPLTFPKPVQSGIRAAVIVKDMFDQGNDVWPERFAVRPQRGDTVQSANGRRLSVLEVVHAEQNGQPILQVEIGVDHNDNIATGGGGGDLL
jgi:hypothetical protein